MENGQNMTGIFKKWMPILVFLLMLLGIECVNVDITYLESAVEKGAVCLDGSPPAYHFDKGFGAGANSWLVHIEGGGWCNDVSSCLERKNNMLGSSKKMAPQLEFSGILSNKPQFNPDFYNWNRIKVRYCDGASFTGDIEAVDPATNLHYRGARVFKAVMEDLLDKGMKNAENTILSGASSGGLASMLHCDSFKALFPVSTKVKCFSDGGYFINARDVSGDWHITGFYDDVVKTHGSAKNLPSYCTSRLSPGLCFFPQYFGQGIRTPLFILNAAYDSWQIPNVLAPGEADSNDFWYNCKFNILKCSDYQLEVLQGFRVEFLRALSELGPSSSRGYFINSCYAHSQTETQETWFSANSPKLNNKTIAEAMGDWYYDRSPFQKIDCPYPCDKTCYNVALETDQKHSAI